MRSSVVWALFLILITGFPIMLSAQDDDPSVEPDWIDYQTELYVAGDQTFIITLGTVFPAVFYHTNDNPKEGIKIGDSADMKFTPSVGGTGSLVYNYYLSSFLFLGGEVSGMFISTLRQNSLFIVPLGVRVGTQFLAGRFEFPIALGLGMAWHTYLDFGYYGFYAKAEMAAFFRATSEWSFGITANWSWLPQWSKNPKSGLYENTIDGHYVYTLLSARYHF